MLDISLVIILCLYNAWMLFANFILLYWVFGDAGRSFFCALWIGGQVVLILYLLSMTVDPLCLNDKLREGYQDDRSAEWIDNDTTDDLILENQPPLAADDKTHIELSDDDEIREQAINNVQQQMNVFANTLDTVYFKEKAEKELNDEYLKRKGVTLSDEEKKNLSPEQVMDLRMDKALKKNMHIDLTDEYEDEINRKVESLLHDQETENGGLYNKKTYMNIGTNKQRQEYVKSQTEFWRRKFYQEVKKDKKDSLINERIEIIKKDEEAKLINTEEQYLKDQRYMNTNLYKSEKLLTEYKSPYQILPLDLWFRPQPGSKDLFTGKGCACPSELIQTNRNSYSVYQEPVVIEEDDNDNDE